MANAWLMRPGSSMIELQPYRFDEGAAHLQYPLFNMRVGPSRRTCRVYLPAFCVKSKALGVAALLRLGCRYHAVAAHDLRPGGISKPLLGCCAAAGNSTLVLCRLCCLPTTLRPCFIMPCLIMPAVPFNRRRTMPRASSGGCCPSATRLPPRRERTRRRGGATPPAMPRSATSCCGELLLQTLELLSGDCCRWGNAPVVRALVKLL